MSAPACSKVETRPTVFQTLPSQQQEWYSGSHLEQGMLQRFLSWVFGNFQLQTSVVALRDFQLSLRAVWWFKPQHPFHDTADTVECWVPQTEMPMPANGSTSQNWWPSRIIWLGMWGKLVDRWQLGEWMDEGKQDAREMVNKISMTVPVYHWRMWWSRKKSHMIKDNIQNGERLFSHSQTVMAIAAFCSRTTGNMTCKLNKTSCDSLNDLTTNNTFNHSNSVKFTVIKHELQSDDLWLTIITHVIRFSQLFSWDSHHFYAQKDIHGLRRQQGSDVGDHVVQIVLGNGLQRNGWMGPWIAWICRWLYKPC